MSYADVFGRSREIILERGWGQGDFVDHDTGAVCAVGAINVALYGNPHGHPSHIPGVRMFANGFVWSRYNLPNLADWNDACGRVKIQVLDLFSAMEAFAREEGI